MIIPFQTRQFLLNDAGEFRGARGRLEMNAAQSELLRMVVRGGVDMEDLAALCARAYGQEGGRAKAALSRFIAARSEFRLGEWTCEAPVEVVILDRGWQGVYQHAISLWQLLNQNQRAVLIAPAEPPYGFDPALESLLVTPERLGGESGSMISFVSLARTLLKKLKPKLCFMSHRALMPYFFDIARSIPTIVHGDYYFDSDLLDGQHMAGTEPDDATPVLQELLYSETPNGMSLQAATASYWMSENAAELWFYTEEQRTLAYDFHQDRPPRYKVVLPLVDAVRYCPAESERLQSSILFVTTNTGATTTAKGLKPLQKVMARLPEDTKLQVVVSNQADVPADLRTSGQVEILEKIRRSEMLGVYRSCSVYCRVSEGDSTPLSVLEAMACGLPVIVSPTIAWNMPCIQDGYNGFVVEPEDTDLLASKLCLLLQDKRLRDEMGARARKGALPYSYEANRWMLKRFFEEPVMAEMS